MNRTTLTLLAVALLLTTAVVGTWTFAQRSDEIDSIESTDLTTHDLVSALDLNIWRFNLNAPSDDYHVHIWAETWFKDVQEPQIDKLASFHRAGTIDNATLVIMLPQEKGEQAYVKLDGTSVRHLMQQVFRDHDEVTSHSLQVIPRQDVAPDHPHTLVTMAASFTSGVSAVLGSSGHDSNDITQHIRIQLTPVTAETQFLYPKFHDGEVRVWPRE